MRLYGHKECNVMLSGESKLHGADLHLSKTADLVDIELFASKEKRNSNTHR